MTDALTHKYNCSWTCFETRLAYTLMLLSIFQVMQLLVMRWMICRLHSALSLCFSVCILYFVAGLSLSLTPSVRSSIIYIVSSSYVAILNSFLHIQNIHVHDKLHVAAPSHGLSKGWPDWGHTFSYVEIRSKLSNWNRVIENIMIKFSFWYWISLVGYDDLYNNKISSKRMHGPALQN